MKKTIVVTALFCVFALTSCAKGNNNEPSGTDELVDRIVNSDIPVLIDFWAAWCMPCRILDPIIEELEKTYEGRIRFVKVDVDKHPAISSYFRVNAVPSVYLIEDRTVRSAFPGVRNRQTYVNAIDEVLKMSAERSKTAPPATKQPSPASEKSCENC